MKYRIVLAAMPAALVFCGSAFADDGRFDRSECDWAMVTAPEKVPVQQAHEFAWDRATFIEYKSWCGQMAADARARLQDEFGVDASRMTAQQSMDRLDEEIDNRRMAHEREMRDRDEAAAQHYAAMEREANANARRNMESASRMQEEQNNMLRGMGVNLGSIGSSDDEEEYEDDISPTELAMYQKMVDEGAAPGCKGMTGMALVDCVDEALDAEE